MAKSQLYPRPGSSKYNRQLLFGVARGFFDRATRDQVLRVSSFKTILKFGVIGVCGLLTYNIVSYNKKFVTVDQECKILLRARGEKVPERPW